MLKIYDDSKNYTAQVIKLPVMQKVEGLDNLVRVNVQGNDCLVSKDSDLDELYLFFPAECQLSAAYLKANNLYREATLNADTTQKGYFELKGRVKSIKFRGIISTGFVIPLSSLGYMNGEWAPSKLSVGDEFNEFEGIEVCRKYIKPVQGVKGFSNPRVKIIDSIVDSRMAPQHQDTAQLLKNVHKLKLDDYVAVTVKLHGTSARYYNTLTKRKLSWVERIAKKLGVKVQEDEYNYVAGSRKVIKSVGFEELPEKNHYYTSGDLWTAVGEEYFKDKLNHGEAVYCEIVGKTYSGEAIQHGYTYGFEKPKVFIYRISYINAQGVEIDLSYHQMKDRAAQLGIDICPEFFYGELRRFLYLHGYPHSTLADDRDLEPALNNIFYDKLLEKPSMFDASVVEEGFCVRIDHFPRPEIFKIKSKNFLLRESKQNDKNVVNLEDVN